MGQFAKLVELTFLLIALLCSTQGIALKKKLLMFLSSPRALPPCKTRALVPRGEEGCWQQRATSRRGRRVGEQKLLFTRMFSEQGQREKSK